MLAALLLSTPAIPGEAENFAACLIGHSVLALETQGNPKDPIAAQEAASTQCPLPDDPKDEIDIDAIGDHVNEVVTAIAGEK